jgi:hypothetical protein
LWLWCHVGLLKEACVRCPCVDAARFLLAAYTTPYISTSVLPAGLSKLVYLFHPAKAAESPAPFADLEFDDQDQQHSVSSPMDSTCVTSPECGGSQGRSPFDHEFDADVKSHKDACVDESPRETAQVPGTPAASLLDRFPIANDSSSADKLLETRPRVSSARKRAHDVRPSADSRGKKLKYRL